MFTQQEFQDLIKEVQGIQAAKQAKQQPKVSRYPITDIGYDQAENLVIDIAIAGFAKEDIAIELVGDQLHIIGKHQPVEQGIRYDQRHISIQDFDRVITLKGAYLAGKIVASERNGILRVKVHPEKLKDERRSIPIE